MSKFKLALGLCVFSSVVSANSIQSLTHFQKANEFMYDTTLGFTSSDTSVAFLEPGTTVTSKYENSLALWNHRFSYGLSDSLNFGVGINYFLSNKSKQTAKTINSTVYTASSTPGTNTFSNFEGNSNGMGDIDLHANYRVLSGDMNFDLLSTLTLSLGDAERGSTTENFDGSAYVNTEGNAKSGGHSLEVNGKMSGKSGSLEYAAQAGFTYNFEREYTNLSAAENQADTANANLKTTIKSNLDFNLGVGAQFLMNESLTFGAGVMVDFFAKEKESQAPYYSNGDLYSDSSTTKSRTDVTLKLDSKFNLTNTMYLGAFFAHTFAGDSKNSGAYSDGTTTTSYTVNRTDLDRTVFGLNYAVTF